MNGYLNFYAITPLTGDLKNKLLARCSFKNTEEGYSSDEAFAIRGIAYDPEERMIFTGDEMGFMRKLDINNLLDKLEMLAPNEDSGQKKNISPDKKGDATFLTGTNMADKLKISEDDVEEIDCWRAHKDAINWVEWIPSLGLAGSSSYDCNVYLWGWDYEVVEPKKIERPKPGQLAA